MNIVTYNAAEILLVAIEIENNAAEYYREAAKSSAATLVRYDLFQGLERMEHEHAKTFAGMVQTLSEDEKGV